MIALCDQCRNFDAQTTRDIKDAWAENEKLRSDQLESIWCKATDQPENLKWRGCPNFRGYSS